IEAARAAILAHDLATLGEIAEADTISMHAICMTQRPPSFYWNASTLTVIHAVRSWRDEGLYAYFTIDAGPNVHVICAASDRAEVERRLGELPGGLFAIGKAGV